MNHTLDRTTYSEMESESEMNCESESRKVTNLLVDLVNNNWSKTHQSTPSGRSPLQDCCLRGNNTDLATHLRKCTKNQTISLQFWHILFAPTCAVITEFQSQEACLLISCSIAIFSFQGFVPQWPGEGGLQQSAFRARSGFLKEFNTSGCASSFFVYISFYCVF